jgi:hypothetical protein
MSSRLVFHQISPKGSTEPHHTGLRRTLLFTDSLRVKIQRSSSVGTPEQFLLHLHVHPEVSIDE